MADRLDAAFAQATRLLFGRPLSPLAKYGEWLRQRVPGGRSVKSCFGKGEAYVPQYGALRQLPADRVASEEDLSLAASRRIAETSCAHDLASLVKQLQDIAYFVPAYAEGRNIDVQQSFLYLNCMGIRHCFDPFTSKNCAYAFSIMDAEALFGMHRIKGGSFSIHCYNCIGVQRCFEMDGAISCTDCMFCHNAENLSDCIFCFDTKAKRYAVGNLEVGKEKYLEFRAKLSAFLLSSLEKTGKAPFDIYDVLCTRR